MNPPEILKLLKRIDSVKRFLPAQDEAKRRENAHDLWQALSIFPDPSGAAFRGLQFPLPLTTI